MTSKVAAGVSQLGSSSPTESQDSKTKKAAALHKVSDLIASMLQGKPAAAAPAPTTGVSTGTPL